MTTIQHEIVQNTKLLRVVDRQDVMQLYNEFLVFRRAILQKDYKIDAKPTILREKLLCANEIYLWEEKKILIDSEVEPSEWVAHGGTHFIQHLNGAIDSAKASSGNADYAVYVTRIAAANAQQILVGVLIEPEAYLSGIMFRRQVIDQNDGKSVLVELCDKLYTILGFYPEFSGIFESIYDNIRLGKISSIPQDAVKICYHHKIEEFVGNRFVAFMGDFIGIAVASLILISTNQDEKEALRILSSGHTKIIGAIKNMKPEEIQNLKQLFVTTR